jgi:hypothetical protein
MIECIVFESIEYRQTYTDSFIYIYLFPRELEGSRGAECRFGEGGYSRVHRRICDLNHIARETPPCHCDSPLAKTPFFRVKGKVQTHSAWPLHTRGTENVLEDTRRIQDVR